MNISNKKQNTHLAASFLCGLLLIIAGSGLTNAQPLSVDKVIAIVDDEVILQSEFDERMVLIKQQITERNIPTPSQDELDKQIMDQLIIEHLQIQMASRGGIRVDDNMLNQAMDNIAQQNSLTFDQFRQLLEEQGAYVQTREQLRRDITLNQLQSSAVSQRINITRQEIENYLRSEAGQANIAPEYRVAHILIPRTSDAELSRQEELATALYDRLQEDNANILQIVDSGQISRISLSGGDLGWNKVETLPSLFTEIVPTLSIGEVAEPFSSGAGQHIVQLLQMRGDTTMEVNQAHVRHILIVPNEIRTEQQAETLINELHMRILDGEDFSDIARQNTDDPSSMVSGGDLDWISDGQLPPDFMEIIHETEIGEITTPFRVSTGWHIAEVIERRVEDLTEDNKRYQAQQTLRERKFENELQNWLTEIRDTAYVDIKD